MSNFWDRVDGIKQQQSAMSIAKQDANIARAADYLNRLEGIKILDHNLHSARDEIMFNSGNNVDALPPDDVLAVLSGNDPNNDVPTFVPPKKGSPTARDYTDSGIAPSTFEYLNADLAKYYGMSKETAYQEAMQNTSYQRAMADMKAAGLNPSVMFGSGRANGAGSVSYPSEASSGGGSSRRSGGSSSKSSGKLFSSSAYGALAAIGGLVGIAATGKPDGFWIGSQTAQGAMSLMNAFNKGK